jgi:hypothetical protein
MGDKEKTIITRRLQSLTADERLFRINAGTGWVGQMQVSNRANQIILNNYRPLQAAPKGWSDLVGITSKIITPDMVGQRVAIFTAEEVKATGTLSLAQKQFGRMVEKLGGIFRVLRK